MPHKRRLLAFSCLLLLFPCESLAREVLAIRQQPGVETITMDPGDISPHKVFTLENPDRLVVDVPYFESEGLSLPSSYQKGFIARLRTGRFTAKVTRVVFDLTRKVEVTRQEDQGGKLVITIDSDTIPPDTEDPIGFILGKWEKPRTEAPKAGKDQIAPSQERKEKPPEVAKKEGKKAAPAKNAKEPVARLKEKPIVVIDPGHGGVDPGTSGASGAMEKMIVMDYALALKNKLQRKGKYQVVLTRTNDQFVMLRKRVEIARKAGGDVFISLHADSAPGGARGLSVYTVSEKASDEEAEALAARENKADVLAGINLENEREDVAGILISLAERDTMNRSATLADLLVSALDDKVQLLPESHRFAGFAVLKAPDIPSVLIEIGFLSHPQEEKQIKSKAYRDKVVSGIAAGVDSYFKRERQLQE